jgi:CheY-like chemotaxis protein
MDKWKILFVDDDPEDRSIIRDAMAEVDGGDIIKFAENGEHALDLLSQCLENSHLPCLIVLDLNMPKLNGTETLRRIKKNEQYQDISVVIYSTSINPLEKEKCIELGARDYITKPVSFRESISTAMRLIEICALHASPI